MLFFSPYATNWDWKSSCGSCVLTPSTPSSSTKGGKKDHGTRRILGWAFLVVVLCPKFSPRPEEREERAHKKKRHGVLVVFRVNNIRVPHLTTIFHPFPPLVTVRSPFSVAKHPPRQKKPWRFPFSPVFFCLSPKPSAFVRLSHPFFCLLLSDYNHFFKLKRVVEKQANQPAKRQSRGYNTRVEGKKRERVGAHLSVQHVLS